MIVPRPYLANPLVIKIAGDLSTSEITVDTKALLTFVNFRRKGWSRSHVRDKKDGWTDKP